MKKFTAIILALLLGLQTFPAFAVQDDYTTLKNGLLNQSTSISIKGSQEYLKDLYRKVVTQEPLILNESLSFTLSTNTIKPKYQVTKKVEIEQRNAVTKKVAEIAKSLFKPNMTAEQKIKGAHDYLRLKISYDSAILDSDPNLEYEKTSASFNVYGALIKNKAVCSGYAESFKLLMQQANVPCVIVSGTLDNVPHAWNKVKISSKWYNIDVTANDTANAYVTYLREDSSNYVADANWELDKEIKNYKSNDGTKEYYRANDRLVQNKEDLLSLITIGQVDFRTEVKLTENDILDAISALGLSGSIEVYISDNVYTVKIT